MVDVCIDGPRIVLRELRESDASEEYCSWLNDEEVNRFLVTREVTLEGLREYIRERRGDSCCLFFGIFLRDGGRHIGNIKLEPIDFEGGKATLGLLIGVKEVWGQGYCTEAVVVLRDYAFSMLGLKELNLGVVRENLAAIRCYEKAGFRVDEVRVVMSVKAR